MTGGGPSSSLPAKTEAGQHRSSSLVAPHRGDIDAVRRRPHLPGRRQPPDGAARLPARPRRPRRCAIACRRSASSRAASWATPCSASAPTKRHPAERVAELVGLGDGLISGPKGYEALGAFNPSERSQALDQLGFDRQFVFSTFATGAFFPPSTDPEHGRRRRPRPQPGHGRVLRRRRAPGGRGRHHARRSRAGRSPSWSTSSSSASAPSGCRTAPPAAAPPATTTSTRSGPAWPTPASPPCLHVGGSVLQLAPAWMNTGRPLPTRLAGRRRERPRQGHDRACTRAAETFVGTHGPRRRAGAPPRACASA